MYSVSYIEKLAESICAFRTNFTLGSYRVTYILICRGAESHWTHWPSCVYLLAMLMYSFSVSKVSCTNLELDLKVIETAFSFTRFVTSEFPSLFETIPYLLRLVELSGRRVHISFTANKQANRRHPIMYARNIRSQAYTSVV